MGALNLPREAGWRRRKYVYGSSREEVDELLSRERERLRAGMQPSDERWTTNDEAASWLVNQRPAIAPTSFARWETLLRLHVAPVIGARPLVRLTPLDVLRVRDRALAAGRSPRTVATVLGLLRMILGAAVRDGRIARNVAIGVRSPDVPARPAVETDPRALLAAWRGHRWAALFTLALASGLRQGELLALTRADVDWTAGTIRVRGGLRSIPRAVRTDGRRLVVGPPKTRNAYRTVPVPRFALDELRAYLASRPASVAGLLFTSSRGRPIDRKDLIRDFHACLASAGLLPLRFHDLRVVHSTLLRTLGTDHAVIAAQLGHAGDVTDRYARVLPALQREAMDRLERELA